MRVNCNAAYEFWGLAKKQGRDTDRQRLHAQSCSDGLRPKSCLTRLARGLFSEGLPEPDALVQRFI
jgi:hypothetical protein